MDLIPKPDQVVSAASNVAHMVLYGGLADLRPMPRTLIDDGTLREVYHYRPAAKVLEQGDPVLLVTPLAAPALCFDLRRGCSLVEHLVGQGRPTYLVEYGEVSFANRTLGMEHWIDEVVPTAIREVSKHHQVLCITHLPQIAVFADAHFNVSKHVEEGRTRSAIQRLRADEQRDEIARMLGGIKITDKTRAAAREMLKTAAK